MNLDFLYNYIMPIILGICLCIGFILKNAIKTDAINKFIPLIMGILGVFLSVWVSGWTFTPEILLTGLISGLASTGLYELFRNFIEKLPNKAAHIQLTLEEDNQENKTE